MKQWEIIKEAQENGAKIRRTMWPKECYVKWEGNTWIDEAGNEYEISAIDLELYIEPIKTFGPDRAMYWLEREMILKRKPWSKNLQIGRRLNGFITFKDGSDIVDWLHNDWHLCDENGNYIPEPEVER